MPNNRRQIAYETLAVTLCAVALAIVVPKATAQSLALPAKAPSGMTETARIALPTAPLRGYGALGGQFAKYGTASDASAASILIVTCPSAEKAKITLAKYNSDLHCLSGVNDVPVVVGAKKIAVPVVAGQGAIASYRTGATVVIVAGRHMPEVVKLLGAVGFTALKDVDYVGAPVPTYLDKFDKWGWGFWFPNPLETPRGQDLTYDVRDKFAWAKKMGVSLQFDIQLNHSVSAGGLIEDAGKQWGINLASEMGIPAFLQMQGGTPPQTLQNRYPEQMQQKAPQFIGSFYGINGNNGFPGAPYNQLSWASVEAADRHFADQYQVVHKYHSLPNVTGYGEIHGEVGEGALAMTMDSGPYVDQRYRDYLKMKYQTPQAVDQRWSSGAGAVKSWSDIHFPEPATFTGFGPQAFDLYGEWRLCYESDLAPDAKANWGATDLYTDSWRKLVVPGDDHQIQKAKWRVPTIFRRTVELTPADLARISASGKTYLYCFTLQQGWGNAMKGFVNGKPLPDQPLAGQESWASFDVTGLLHEGANVVALSLPWGEISYRTYLSPDEPKCYPDLGHDRNAQWVDYRDFITWIHEDQLRRSMEAIRRDDPDKVIKLYAPGAIVDVMKNLAEDYGAYFHDTGFMGGNWNDDLPGLMRSSGMPMSVEPGNSAHSIPELQSAIGRWMTEGLNTLDYFDDITEIMWQPDQKAWFEAHQPLIHLLGKCHYPASEVAVLEGARAHRLTGFPFDHFNTQLLWWNRHGGVGTYGRMPDPRDLIAESDIMRGTVSKYKVIVDDATLVMDDALIDKIDAWVRAGGIFITQGQTGRHSVLAADAWPISRLTGYKSIGNNDNWRVAAIPGQTIFKDPAWTKTDDHGAPVLGAAGNFFQKVAPECQDILAWPGNAGVAMGIRPLGKGKVITMGTAMPNVPNGWNDLLAYCGVNVPILPVAQGCRIARYVSNNGLYDIYVVWVQDNESTKGRGGVITAPTNITLTVPSTQPTMIDMRTGQTVTGRLEGGNVSFDNLHIEPLETYAFLVPRQTVTDAPLAWLSLQRDWWKGTTPPAPAPKMRSWNNTLDLDAGWAFKPLAADVTDVAALVDPKADDAAWTRMDIGVWFGTKFADVKRGVFRKHFTMPADWVGTDKGRVWLWLKRSQGAVFLPPYKTKVFVDGQQVYDSGGWLYASCVVELTGKLAAGDHVVAVSTESSTPVGGYAGNVWLEHIPAPIATQSLAGDWNGIQLPGASKPPLPEMKRTFTPDPAIRGKHAVLLVETTTNNIVGIFLNGRLINRDIGGQHFLIDITPFLKSGQPNSISLNPQYDQNPLDLKSVEIRYYDEGAL